jgi:hypothetical protein
MQTTPTSQTLRSIPRERSTLDVLPDISWAKVQLSLTLFEQPNGTATR